MTGNNAKGNNAGPGKPLPASSECIAGDPGTAGSTKLSGPAAAAWKAENPELDWARRHVERYGPVVPPAKSVFRKTELHRTEPRFTRDKQKRQEKALRYFMERDREIILNPSGLNMRDLVYTIMEKEKIDRERLHQRIADLDQRIDELSEWIRKSKPSLNADSGPTGNS
jgi:hypothetical protein